MPLTLATSWAVRAAAAEPVAVVRVRNLQAVTEAASDAWGRPSKPQPLLISAEISFSQPFTTAAAQDCLTAETVHYGTLSRAILNALEGSTLMLSANQVGLHRIVHDIWLHLTGQHLSTGQESTTEGHLLSAEVRNGIQFLSITATLPKASLLGTGVSFTASAAFNARMYSTELRLHELRVPTLVGMNDNERLAKQFIVITVALDMLRDIPGDFYVEAEALVVKVCTHNTTPLIWGMALDINISRPANHL